MIILIGKVFKMHLVQGFTPNPAEVSSVRNETNFITKTKKLCEKEQDTS